MGHGGRARRRRLEQAWVGVVAFCGAFDITNPSDALVIAPYSGTTNLWQPFDRLLASDGSPSPAVSCDADGRLTAGFGLTVTGTTTLSSTLTLSGGNLIFSADHSLQGRTITLNNNTVLSFTPPSTQGVYLFYTRATSATGAIAIYRTSPSAYNHTLTITSSTMALGTGILTDGTGNGVDLRMNVNTHSDGRIYVKNRLGSAATSCIVFLSN